MVDDKDVPGRLNDRLRLGLDLGRSQQVSHRKRIILNDVVRIARRKRDRKNRDATSLSWPRSRACVESA